MTCRHAATATLFLIAAATQAIAWNALGHKTIAEIAWRAIDAKQRQEIVDTLRRHPRFDADFAGKMTDDVLSADKATQDRWIFQHSATWPDIARGLPAGERGKYDRPKWHYVNFPLYLAPSDERALAPLPRVNRSTDYLGSIDKDDYNILQAIQHCQAAIKSRAGADVKALAYCWLFHLIGDIHQPLHSTALFSVDQFPRGDRGGNSIPLARGRNLHALWDNLLGRQHYLRNVDKEVAELSQKYRDVWETAADETDALTWAEESHALAESFAYDGMILNAVRALSRGGELEPIELSEAYYRKAGDHARRRIIAAGVRLGVLLGGKPLQPRPVRNEAKVSGALPTSLADPSIQDRQTSETTQLTHWLNTNTGVRHNRSCRWFGNTKGGRNCTANEGKPCGQCGG